jgi:GT2 family glycosyltransferase
MIETVILVPSKDGLEHLDGCFKSIYKQKYKKFKLILIDDGSKDQSVNFVKKNFSKADIIKLNKNQGFVKAINKGINYSIQKYNPKYIALLNNDTRVDKNWLYYLVKKINQEKNIASIASSMLSYYDPNKIDSYGGTFTKSLPNVPVDIGAGKKVKNFNSPNQVISPCWGAALLNVSILNKIGLADNRYFSYVEDFDWGWRATILGYKNLFEPKAKVYHKHSATWNKQPFKKEYLLRRNLLCSALKNFEPRYLLWFMPTIFYLHIQLPRLFFRKKELPFNQRVQYLIIPFKSILWNIISLPKTLLLRQKIQSKRKISDKKLMELA